MREYQWHIVRRGSPGNPPLWFFHGFMGDARDWETVMSQLASDFYCLAIDLPGHGQTRTFDSDDFYTMPRVADALAEVIGGFATPAYLVGYSMGGRLALYLAVHYGRLFDAVVVESGSPGLQDEDERRQRQGRDDSLARQLETGEFEHFLRWWYSQPLFATLADDSARLEQVIARRLRQDPRGLARSLRTMGSGVQPPLWDKLATARCPMHLIVGENDHKFRQIAARVTQMNDGLTTTVIESAGHNAHEECPEMFTKALKRLLQRG